MYSTTARILVRTDLLSLSSQSLSLASARSSSINTKYTEMYKGRINGSSYLPMIGRKSRISFFISDTAVHSRWLGPGVYDDSFPARFIVEF